MNQEEQMKYFQILDQIKENGVATLYAIRGSSVGSVYTISKEQFADQIEAFNEDEIVRVQCNFNGCPIRLDQSLSWTHENLSMEKPQS